MQRKIVLVILFAIISTVATAEDIHFAKTQQCYQMGPDTCNQWRTTISLTQHHSFSHYMCFPAGTTVRTQSGPKPLDQLSVGDSIYGYDFAQSRPVFTEVTAWIHRDTDTRAQFTSIRTKNGLVYKASSGHNIGYSDDGVLGFKYADQLREGDQLIALGGRQVVLGSGESSYETGLYSPLTSVGNFYVYPFSEGQSSQNRDDELILVHCLAQIDDPQGRQHWIQHIMQVSGLLGMNDHKNVQHEAYLHPVTHLMRILGSEHRRTKYLVVEGDVGQLRHEAVSTSSQQQQRAQQIRLMILNLILQLNLQIIS